ncbi:TPA: UbiA family prenyltransferase [Candidatus Bathyarchaeota archaeon]|nr:UbiA family prenyltransferase [Candidatus Bathyarchaeota archaeon]
MQTLKAYIDLTRIQFFFVWPLLFLSGLFLSFQVYGGFDWLLVAKAAAIALLGFEAGFVLNDIVDRDHDAKDVEHDKLTKYWRVFGGRPLPTGRVSLRGAYILFAVFAVAATALILTLPSPHSYWVLAIMAYSYIVEVFYQFRKRGQRLPLAQLIGRTDFSLFPVAGYLVNGQPDLIPLLYFLFFYPYAQAHLGMNDLIDVANDEARGMATPATLYGLNGTKIWILSFTVLHFIGAVFFTSVLRPAAVIGVGVGLLLLLIANMAVQKKATPESALKVLPLFHAAMLVYTASIILSHFL